MKVAVIIVMMLGLVASMQAQVLTIIDSDTQAPIKMANILNIQAKTYATTDDDGKADISAFKGMEKVEIRCIGYNTVTKTFAELAQMDFLLPLLVSNTIFDEVVISATRWSQSTRNIPSKISVISPRQAALLNPQTAADLLGTSGEVFIQKSQQGGGSPMVRGFSANRLLYSVDGVRMNSAIFRAGNLQNVISLDPLAIEQTEVLFGPGSIIYGSDAIGGVMSFQTLSPTLSLTNKPNFSGKAVSRYSSANEELSAHLDINLGWKKWAFVTSLTHSKYSDLRMGANGDYDYSRGFYVQRIDSLDKVIENPNPLVQTPSGYKQLNLMQKIRFVPNANWDINYGFHLSETSDYARYDRLIETQANGLPVSAVWNYGPQKWMMNQLSVSNAQGNKVFDKATLRLAHQLFEESRIDRRYNHHRLRTNLEEVQAYSANLDFERVITKHNWHYGFEYVINDVASVGSAVDIRDGSPILVADRYPASTWRSAATYLNYQYHASEQFLVQAGVRYSSFRIESDFSRNLAFFPFDFKITNIQNGAFNGSLGAVYKPAATWKISANVSSGFRAPNVDDIGKIFDFGDGEVVVPNITLRAEQVYNAEMNVSKVFNDVVKLDFTGFYTYLDDAMVRRPFQVNGQDSILYDGVLSKVFAIQNAAYGTVWGFNAGIEVKLRSGFGLLSRYNYQLGREEMDNGDIAPSRHAAPAFGITRLTFKKGKLDMQVYAMYSAAVSYKNLNPEEQGKRFIYAKDSAGDPFSPSWFTLNFKGMYQLHRNLSVSAGLENMMDVRYRTYSSGMVAAGRNVVVSLGAKF